jgi:hypothetical protein
VTLELDGIDRLEGLANPFRAGFAPLLAGAGDRLHAVRVNLTGCTPLHQIEANRPGTLEAAIRAAAQDLEAEVWVERVRLDLSTPLDRAQAAERQDAVGELIRLVDALAADPSALAVWVQTGLDPLLKALPAELAGDDGLPSLDAADALAALLRDAEATVLARLAAGAPAGTPAGSQAGGQP